MLKISKPKTRKQLRSFIGVVNYYRDMWQKRSEVLASLTELTSTTAPWEQKEKHNKAFFTMNEIISRETPLAYPDFLCLFKINTDASDYQLGAVMSQNNKMIVFYSYKLNAAQTWYTTTEKELLAIVETLKEFKNILLGQDIKVYTDH